MPHKIVPDRATAVFTVNASVSQEEGHNYASDRL
ncbi:DUF3077 domain-containing protein, partial [Pseudomonas syringae pv. tagetis]